MSLGEKRQRGFTRMGRSIFADRPVSGTPPVRGVLIEEAITRTVIGAFFAVYNELGYGFLESVYRNALLLELARRDVLAEAEVAIDVTYKGEAVGLFRADVLVERRVLLELKATQSVGAADRRQLLNYLKATGTAVGILLHFGPRARFYRVVHGQESSGPRGDP